MSDPIKHECGIAMLRLLKPLDFYQKKYNTPFYALNKMYLLMEKQHNRGQDGAGLANIKLNVKPGQRFISRLRSNAQQPIQNIFKKINDKLNAAKENNPELYSSTEKLKEYLPFTGELFLGHLRYGTYGGNSIEQCHPFLRQNNWMTRNLIVAGNFNMTNSNELFNDLVELGQHPKEETDTVTILEKIGHFLDEENEALYCKYKSEGHSKQKISLMLSEDLNIQSILTNSAKRWDGGYVIAGMIGHGDSFVMRDPNGIRPCYYYYDDEIAVVASERPVIQTTFNVPFNSIKELPPANAIIIKKNSLIDILPFTDPLEKKSCSFERIYFSRGSDANIYRERINLGKSLATDVIKLVNKDLRNTVFSFIPNTAENAFYGLVKEINSYLNRVKLEKIKNIDTKNDGILEQILNINARIEKIAIKDAKLRTFITDDISRDELVAHVYDVTYGTVKSSDNLVVVDDSIVRGTTLKHSVIKILARLNPKKIIVTSSAPQIRYPDCYGIDMAKLGDFIAFKAAIALLKEKGMEEKIDQVYQQCKTQLLKEKEEMTNCVKAIYEPLTTQEISDKISQLLTPKNISIPVKILYQSIENLHKCCPKHLGDWYFTGNYPTPGGNRVVNKSFVNFIEGKNERAY